jgi:YesN/AraC family two-component response regulator
MSVVARAGDAPGLIAAVRSTTPDVVITDIRMPPCFRTTG